MYPARLLIFTLWRRDQCHSARHTISCQSQQMNRQLRATSRDTRHAHDAGYRTDTTTAGGGSRRARRTAPDAPCGLVPSIGVAPLHSRQKTQPVRPCFFHCPLITVQKNIMKERVCAYSAPLPVSFPAVCALHLDLVLTLLHARFGRTLPDNGPELHATSTRKWMLRSVPCLTAYVEGCQKRGRAQSG